MGICTRFNYLSWSVFLIFWRINPINPPDAAIFFALIDYKHYVSSAITKRSYSNPCKSCIRLQAPIGSENTILPYNTPESGL